MNYIKGFKDWSRLLEDAQQSEQQKEGWDDGPIQWAIQNGYAEKSYSSGSVKFIYSKIKNCINVDHIAKLIFHSYDSASYDKFFGLGSNDTEAVAEAAFEALAKNPGWYGNVTNKLSNLVAGGKKNNTWTHTDIPEDVPTDPYLFCKYFMKTSTKYRGSSPSIDESYKKIQAAQ